MGQESWVMNSIQHATHFISAESWILKAPGEALNYCFDIEHFITDCTRFVHTYPDNPLLKVHEIKKRMSLPAHPASFTKVNTTQKCLLNTTFL